MTLNDDGSRATCDSCGYQWEPRCASPKECPSCKTYLWNSGKPSRRRSRA
jgi:predicted Zn-ribbon and HTH transcriptional regulator